MTRSILIISFALFSCVQVLAQANNGTARLSIHDAVKFGLENNVKLNQEKNQLAYTQINKTSTMLQLGPTVDARADAYRVDGNSFNQQEGRVVNGKIDYITGSVDASIPVFAGLRNVNTFRAANKQNEAQLHLVNRSTQDVIRDVAFQYLTCLLDQELIKIDEENLQTQRVTYDQIKAQVELGAKAEADLYNQEYQVKNAELQLVKSKNQLVNDMATLALTIGVDPNTYFEVEEVNWDINEMVADTLSVNELLATAADRRSDLKNAQSAEEAAKYTFASFKGQYFPSIYAGASYGSRYNYIYGESNRSFNQQFREDNTSLSYGVSLSVPIYYGLRNRARAAQSRALYENAKVTTSNQALKVKSDVVVAIQNFRNTKTSYAAAEAQLKAAEQTFKMEKERYDLGISSMVQFTTTNQALVKAKADFQSAKYNLMFQKLLINYASGTLKQEDIP